MRERERDHVCCGERRFVCVFREREAEFSVGIERRVCHQREMSLEIIYAKLSK